MLYMDKPELTLIVGPSGCGKTHTLLHDILESERLRFDFIVIVCPTLALNKTYREWKHTTQAYEIEVPPDKLEGVLKYLIDTCRDFRPLRMAIVIDDMSSGIEQHKSTGQLPLIAYSGRHYGISLFVVSQKLNSISTALRANTTRLLFFPTPNRHSIRVLRDEFFGFLDEEGERETLREFRGPSTRYLDIDVVNGTYTIKRRGGG